MGRRPDHPVDTIAATGGPFGYARAAIAAAATIGALLAIALVMLLGASAGAGATTVGSVCHADGNAAEIPQEFVSYYAEAARRYELGARGPAILASIHNHETAFGTNQGPSSAGAVGHMQFMPATWRAYGIDADHDGTADPHNAADAIHAAANYLHASGAPTNWAGAIFSYNHADWYVRMILDTADGYQGLCNQTVITPAEMGDLPADPVERIVRVASWIDQGRHPYCWGGGHATSPGPSTGSYCWGSAGAKAYGTSERGLDCSGAVRWLLVLAGYADPGGIASGSFAHAYPAGRGRHITIWSNAAHVFIEVHGKGSWGTTQTNYRHGPGWIASYPTAGFAPSHPPGL